MKKTYLLFVLLLLACFLQSCAKPAEQEKLGRFRYTMPFSLEIQNERQNFRSYGPAKNLNFATVRTGTDEEKKMATERDVLDHLLSSISGNCSDAVSFSRDGICFASCISRYGDSFDTYLCALRDHSLILFTFNAQEPLDRNTIDSLAMSIEVINPGLSVPDLTEQWMNGAYGK